MACGMRPASVMRGNSYLAVGSEHCLVKIVVGLDYIVREIFLIIFGSAMLGVDPRL